MALLDSRGIVDGQITNHKLLVTDLNPVLSSVEYDVSHKTTTPILHEHALVIVIGSGGHLDHNIDERSSLRNLPVQTNCRS